MKSFYAYLPLMLVLSILTAGWWIRPAQIEAVPLCFFNYFFHFDCPGCGLTRSFLALVRGHFLQALHYNAAGPLIYLLFVIYALDSVRQILGKRRLSFHPWVGNVYSLSVVSLLFGQWMVKLFY